MFSSVWSSLQLRRWDWNYAHLTNEDTETAVLSWAELGLEPGGWASRLTCSACSRAFFKSVSDLKLWYWSQWNLSIYFDIFLFFFYQKRVWFLALLLSQETCSKFRWCNTFSRKILYLQTVVDDWSLRLQMLAEFVLCGLPPLETGV